MQGNTPTTWRSFVLSLYPDALRRTYCVPSVHFNRVPYNRDTVPGTGQSALVLSVLFTPPVHTVPLVSQPSGSATPVHSVPLVSQPSGSATPVHSVPPASQPSGSATPVHNVPLVSQPSGSAAPVHSVAPVSQLLNPPTQYCLWTQEPQPPARPLRVQESDFRDDHCQQFVLKNLQELGKTGQVMFILSQFHYGGYLNKPSYAAAAAQLPRPIIMAPAYREGDFDVLVIHRRYGILIGEVKTVGMNQANLNWSAAQADSVLANRVRQAVKQLDKSEAVLRHLVSDIAPDLVMKKTLFLPYVSKAQLQRVLTADPLLGQEVCRSLGAGNAADAVQLCCCSDQLSNPATYWDVTPADLLQLTSWWQHRMTCTIDTCLTDDIYLDILARFVGPATSVTVYSAVPPRVEVRTEGEAVAELGLRLACLVLTPHQLDVMHRSPPRVFLTGPPGTGKTILLVLQGLRLLRQGRDVDVVSIHPDTLAVSLVIQHQLQMTLSADSTTSPTPGTVRFHQYDFSRRSDVDRAVRDLLSVVQDDTLCVLVDEANTLSPCSDQGLQRLVSKLTGWVTNLYLWCAGVFHTAIPPALQEEVLTTPLRSAPVVLRAMQPVLDVWSREVHGYSDSGLPAPGDGPSVVHLRHCGPCHTCRHPVDCARCGCDVAALLRHLGVGTAGLESFSGSAPLSYRDVLILTGSDELRDDVIDVAGRVTSPASGFVRGLRAEGVPVCVLERIDRVGGGDGVGGSVGGGSVDRAGWESRVADVAVSRTDRVTVADWRCVQGLERRVVVWLAERERTVSLYYRLNALSRCTSQLIVVDANLPDSDADEMMAEPTLL